MRSLEKVIVTGTHVTDEAVRRFQSSLPMCKVQPIAGGSIIGIRKGILLW